MSIDTFGKRFSALNIGLPWRGINVLPGTLGVDARLGSAFLYAGIALLEPSPPEPVVESIPATDPDRFPQVMMRFSPNGGKKWFNERWRSMGKLGESDTTVPWMNCGVGRRGQFEISGTASVAVVINTALIETEPLDS